MLTAIKQYIKQIPKWIFVVSGLIFLRYGISIVLIAGLWNLFETWNYMASVYFYEPLNLALSCFAILMSLILIIFSKPWLIKATGILSLLVAVIDFLLRLLCIGYYGPFEELKAVKSPDGIKTAIVYHHGETLSADDMVIVVKQPGQFFFPKTLYVSDEKGNMNLVWLNNHTLEVTSSGEILTLLDIRDSARILPH